MEGTKISKEGSAISWRCAIEDTRTSNTIWRCAPSSSGEAALDLVADISELKCGRLEKDVNAMNECAGSECDMQKFKGYAHVIEALSGIRIRGNSRAVSASHTACGGDESKGTRT
jgi:hypothetical protein